MRVFLPLLMACDFSASTTVLPDESELDSATSDFSRVDTSESDTFDDIDGDGFSVEEGDCDDNDAEISPGLTDDCDGQDTDCDGQLDEDAEPNDGYEPNDTEAWGLGVLEDEDSFYLEARLHNEQDVDLFEVQIEDSYTNLFNLEVALESIPAGAIYALEVFSADTGEVFYSNSGSESLWMEIEDTAIDDESGSFIIAIRSLGGTDCSKQYALLIDYLEWGW